MEIGNNVGIANFILGKLLICTGQFTELSEPCTPSLAAAIGTTACIAVAVPSIATITRGT
jgi:hypothetical protein